ncbi:winged helix-turn-helix domain-containing protein [Bdellovibrio sp. SKB1291214]|uniref:winged helix-turn-helix domain-containing protein n=1 Tax=Bdellovibrio sp. SKB1291214 TaxID=1732569 RepID=UPI000B51E41D|nr:winged helix-turn-helix domain-containing protein [Bdellovibrio sp. SKB1291214]UYL08083.1 winged helix-turn-helix domain-containing protein [Bdellovibrio sp. SKB1291214]
MLSELSSNINLAKLNYQRGHYQDACDNSVRICTESEAIGDLQNWLYGIRFLIQASSELGKLDHFKKHFNKLLTYEKENPDSEIHGRILHNIGLWRMAQGENVLAKDYFVQALDECTSAQDLETVARLLQELAMVTMKANPIEALKYLDKALLLTQELKLEEIHTSCLVVKSHVFLDEKRADDALDAIWKAYEKAQQNSLHYLIVYILVQMAAVYEAQGKRNEAAIYRSLAMKGMDGELSARLRSVKAQLAKENQVSPEADLSIDSTNFKVKSGSKGEVDFKNQHILFDLLKLFAQNQGSRFTKSYLVEKIWGYAYDPAVHDNIIYVSIKRLRTLLEPDPNTPSYILRDRKGYYLPTNITVKLME